MATGNYRSSLSGDVLNRYIEKINLIMGIDPYDISIDSLSKNIGDFPEVHYFDILNYLKYARSPYTEEELRSVKSTEAYRFFTCGWVQNLGVKKIQNHILVLGEVLHSQKLGQRATPLQPWIIAKPSGEIVCGHCTCVAGLGERCSHIGALLFALEAAVRDYDPVSVTGKKAYWMIPSKSIGSQSKVKDLDFISPKRKFEDLGEGPSSLIKYRIVEEPTMEEQQNFLKQMEPCGSAILNVRTPFCFNIQAKNEELQSQFLTALYEEEYKGKQLEELQKIGEEIDKTMTQEQCNWIENQTRTGSKSIWHGFRSGRVTASLFKRACRTNVLKPSLSLIKQICYPEKYNFSTAATRHGCLHEKIALEEYQKQESKKHINMKIDTVGLVVNPMYPMFGATPDGLVSCDCHGEGCIEIKCPYCVRDINILEIRDFKNFCLQRSDNNDLFLSESHSYYYQVQMQLTVTGKKYCDFIVRTSKSLFIQKITLNASFWESESKKALEFHKKVILPELLGQHFTRIQNTPSDEELWCVCKQPDIGTPMIACESIQCNVVWFHFSCVGLSELPEEPWICEVCKQRSSESSQ